MARPTVMTPETIAIELALDYYYSNGYLHQKKARLRDINSYISSMFGSVPMENYFMFKEAMHFLMKRVNKKQKCQTCGDIKSTLYFGYRLRHCVDCKDDFKQLSRLRVQETRRSRKQLIRDTKDGSINAKSLKELMEKQGYSCNACRKDIHKDNHLDHIFPLSKGGTHIIANVQYLCSKCNLTKHERLGWTYEG